MLGVKGRQGKRCDAVRAYLGGIFAQTEYTVLGAKHRGIVDLEIAAEIKIMMVPGLEPRVIGGDKMRHIRNT